MHAFDELAVSATHACVASRKNSSFLLVRWGMEGGETSSQCAPPSVVRMGPYAQPVVEFNILAGLGGGAAHCRATELHEAATAGGEGIRYGVGVVTGCGSPNNLASRTRKATATANAISAAAARSWIGQERRPGRPGCGRSSRGVTSIRAKMRRSSSGAAGSKRS